VIVQSPPCDDRLLTPDQAPPPRRGAIRSSWPRWRSSRRTGARVERVAERAACSPGLLYAYFDSKESLFDALFAEIVSRTQAEIPLDVDDLPDQVARLFEGNQLYLEVFRLVMWHLLERGDERIDVAVQGTATRVAELAEGQHEGRVLRDFSPEQLHALMVELGALWSTLPPEIRDLIPDEQTRRDTIVGAMRRIVG
jgi:AcrR family transcriptional regulator